MSSFLQRVVRFLSELAEPPPEPRQTVSKLTQSRPGIKGWEDDDDRAPNKVEHELIFVAPERRFEYEVLATWRNSDPYAESSSSTIHKKFDVRRGDAGEWEIRLLARNYSKMRDEEPWEPAPKRLVRNWEAAYQKIITASSAGEGDSPSGPSSSE